ncbi:MAG: RodZ domain-containing protein [Acidobacteriota bacterium]
MGNFGNYLRERRREKGITSEYISLNTSLNENVLNALENENFDFFSSSFYFSNFLNNYLDFLEIDRERFYSDFSEELVFLKQKKNIQLVKSMTGLRYSKFRNKKFIIRSIIVGIILAVIIYLTFVNKGYLFSFFAQERVTLPETSAAITAMPEHEPDFSPVNIRLKFSDDCWARIFRGDKIIEEKVFISGEKFQISGYDIKLIIGNPSVVDININGINTLKYKKISRTAILKITPDTIDRIIYWNH